ncbi:MAG: Holliday junction branch migration protein RuvA [Phycisphaerales bacterium JB043]
MIARIDGSLVSVEEGRATIDVDALGMWVEVMVPTYLAEDLRGRVGQIVRLHTLLHLDPVGQSGSLSPRLIGFGEAQEREFFTLFTTVKGVGGKRALRAMVEPSGEIAGHIARRDLAALQRLPEIGKRLAETIVAELHGKVDPFVELDVRVAGEKKRSSSSAPVEQAIEALVRLGESRSEAEQKVRRVAERDASLTSAGQLLSAALSHNG